MMQTTKGLMPGRGAASDETGLAGRGRMGTTLGVLGMRHPYLDAAAASQLLSGLRSAFIAALLPEPFAKQAAGFASFLALQNSE